jgi:hypothetical protein
MNSRTRLATLVTAVALACGCDGERAEPSERSNDLVAVEGVVTRRGKPLPHVQVTFHKADSLEPCAYGLTDENGRYRLETSVDRFGIETGSYRVSLLERGSSKPRLPVPGGKAAPAEVAARMKPSKAVVPVEYGRPNETPLRIEVVAGSPRAFDIPVP